MFWHPWWPLVIKRRTMTAGQQQCLLLIRCESSSTEMGLGALSPKEDQMPSLRRPSTTRGFWAVPARSSAWEEVRLASVLTWSPSSTPPPWAPPARGAGWPWLDLSCSGSWGALPDGDSWPHPLLPHVTPALVSLAAVPRSIGLPDMTLWTFCSQVHLGHSLVATPPGVPVNLRPPPDL